jgi:hypothetical protein
VPIDTTVPYSDGWWLQRLHNQLRVQRIECQKLWDRYEGDAPLPTVNKNQAEAVRWFIGQSRTNWERLIVAAVLSRLRIRGIRTAKDNDEGGDVEGSRPGRSSARQALGPRRPQVRPGHAQGLRRRRPGRQGQAAGHRRGPPPDDGHHRPGRPAEGHRRAEAVLRRRPPAGRRLPVPAGRRRQLPAVPARPQVGRPSPRWSATSSTRRRSTGTDILADGEIRPSRSRTGSRRPASWPARARSSSSRTRTAWPSSSRTSRCWTGSTSRSSSG